LIYIKRFFTGLGVITFLSIIAAFIYLGFSSDDKKSLPGHPNAQWRGGADGGAYFEITQATSPYFHIQIRHENGSLWTEGWFKYEEASSEKVIERIISYDGGTSISLYQSAELSKTKPVQ